MSNLTFEQLCPEWNKYLKGNLKNIVYPIEDIGIKLDIAVPRICILGEAWGFNNVYSYPSSEYYCNTCDNIGIEFADISDRISNCEDIDECADIYMKTENRFINHINKCRQYKRFKKAIDDGQKTKV